MGGWGSKVILGLSFSLKLLSENTHHVYMEYLTIGTIFLLCNVTLRAPVGANDNLT